LLKKLSLLLTVLFCLFSLPGYCQEEDEQLLEDLQKDRAKQIQAAKQLNEMKENVEKSRFDPHAEIKKLGYDGINAKALTDIKVLKIVQKMMDQSGLKNAPKDEVRKTVLQQVSPRTKEFFSKHPKILDISVDVLRDEKAMSSLVNILMRKDDLKLYAVIYICLVLLNWLFKKIFYRKTWSKTKTLVISLTLTITLGTLSLATFYKLFQQELTPFITIVSNHW
jgi:hypothetical protein